MFDFVAIQGLHSTLLQFYTAISREQALFRLKPRGTSNLLVNPLGLGGLPLEDLGRREPEGNLLLGVLNAVGAVADIAADIDGVVTTDGAGGGSQGVGGTEDGAAGLDSVLALPDHGADGAAQHV